MFDISFTELMVIGVIALIVIGPERLPKVARTVGHLLGRAQRYVNDVKSDIRRELELDELRKFKSEMESAAQNVQTSMRDTEATLREPAQALRQELDDAAKAATGALSLQSHAVPAAAAAPATPAAEAAAAPALPDAALPPAAEQPAPPAAVSVAAAVTHAPAPAVEPASAVHALDSTSATAAFPPVEGGTPKPNPPTGTPT